MNIFQRFIRRWQPKASAPARVVEHNPRVVAIAQLAGEVLPNGLFAHVFRSGAAVILPDRTLRAGSGSLFVVITRWPTIDEVAAGTRSSPVQVAEHPCESIEAGLRWARENASRYMERAR